MCTGLCGPGLHLEDVAIDHVIPLQIDGIRSTDLNAGTKHTNAVTTGLPTVANARRAPLDLVYMRYEKVRVRQDNLSYTGYDPDALNIALTILVFQQHLQQTYPSRRYSLLVTTSSTDGNRTHSLLQGCSGRALS